MVGGKVVASMERMNDLDFRSNVEQGGKTYVVELSDHARNVAEKVSKVLGLDYCGVDLLTDEKGEVKAVGIDSKKLIGKTSKNTKRKGVLCAKLPCTKNTLP